MSVRRALRFTTLAAAANFLLSLVSVIVVSRLLRPEEIGVFSVAVSLVAYTHILREFGVGQYFVQLKDLTRDHLRAGFTVMLLISWGIAAILLVARGPVSVFYAHNGLADVFTVLALNFVILPFGSPILSILKREMQFGRLAIISVSNSTVQVTVTITTALAGESYMSMAWGSIAGNLTNVLMLSLMRRDVALLMPTFQGLGAVVSFGSKASGSSLINQLGASGPDLILGKTVGFEAVANFSRASSLNHMILGKVNEIIGQVFFPAFAQGIREGKPSAAMYCDAMKLITGINVPLLGVLTLLAQPLILLFFGSQWHEAAYLATFLCLYQLMRAPVAFAGNALMAGGHAGAVLRNESIIQSVTLCILALSIWLDLEQVVYMLLIVPLVNISAFGRALSKHYTLSPLQLLRAVGPSYALLPATLVGPLLVLGAAHYEALTITPSVQVAVASALATLGYVAALRITQHPVREELVRLAPPLAWILGPIQRRPG